MAKDHTFRCTLITPEAAVLDTQTTSVCFPAHDGLIGVLHDRAPLMCKMGIGAVVIDSPAGKQSYYVDGGFAQILDNTLTLLTEHAQEAESVKADEARAELAKARARRAPDEESARQKTLETTRARVKLTIAASDRKRPVWIATPEFNGDR